MSLKETIDFHRNARGTEPRKCPICERLLKDIDFYDKNIQYGLEQCESWWNEINLKIPCCYCFKKLDLITNNEIENVEFKKSIYVPNYYSIVFKDKSIFTILSPLQYDNLKKWGLL